MTVLVSETQIAVRVKELAEEIDEQYADLEKPLVLLVVLKGAMVFATDLMRQLLVPVEVATVYAYSYKRGRSLGRVKITYKDIRLKDRDVLIVEDIVDSGITIRALYVRVEELNVRSMRAVTLLSRGLREEANWVGFKIPAGFVYGYGLDARDGTERNLKYICIHGT